MKIVKIESFTSKENFITIVKVTSEDGSFGYGQLATYYSDVTSYVMHRQVCQYFLGQNVSDIQSIINITIEKTSKFIGSHICRSIAGIETAILDLLAKNEKKSVCEYLGGLIKPILVYGSSMSREITPNNEAKRILELKSQNGFQAFKIRIGNVFGHDIDAWEGRTEEIVPTVRKAIGYDTDLLCDANSGYSVKKAIEVGKMLEQYKIFHFEEPCPYMNQEWTKEVKENINLDVAGGEQDNVMNTWKRMIDNQVVDIVQPDILYIGGVHRALKVAKMAKKSNLVCTPHAANHSLVTLFTAHFLGAIENAGKYMEFSIEDVSWVKNLYEPMLKVKDGKINISGEPGWGIRINESWLQNTKYHKTTINS